MKLLLPPFAMVVKRALVILLLFASCKKSAVRAPATPVVEDKAKNYIGTYHVTEDAMVYYPPGDSTHVEFTGQVIRDYSLRGSILPNDLIFTDTLNIISFVQSGRNPAPEWAVPGREIDYGSDTICFKIMKDPAGTGRDTIISAYGVPVEIRVLSKDSIGLSYIFGVGSVAYLINQMWVKQ